MHGTAASQRTLVPPPAGAPTSLTADANRQRATGQVRRATIAPDHVRSNLRTFRKVFCTPKGVRNEVAFTWGSASYPSFSGPRSFTLLALQSPHKRGNRFVNRFSGLLKNPPGFRPGGRC